MRGDKLNVVRAWFQKAENDLITSEHTMKMKKPPCDTVCFHAQQCAEKYLKGYLTYLEIEFPKTHSIEDLILLCRGVYPSIESETSDAEILSSYGVEVRYPSEVYYEIPREDAEEAIAIALLWGQGHWCPCGWV
ncbi:MAG: HEPN domain-containing protein [Nitrospirae bacterium]|nr:HEPN domain-containing protein [Nitrospirota bacterium]MBF0592009.1 HEPN domain-containing protein [Nitrospirota bacterium]